MTLGSSRLSLTVSRLFPIIYFGAALPFNIKHKIRIEN